MSDNRKLRAALGAAAVALDDLANGRGLTAPIERTLKQVSDALDTPSSEEVDDGGPAFPCEGGDLSGLYAAPGMTFRAWAAGKALQGLLASGDCAVGPTHEEVAQLAVEYADALLAALAARKEK